VTTKMCVLAAAALGPFTVSRIPMVYVALVSFYPITYPVCAVYGVLWCVLFWHLYAHADVGGRRRLRLLAPLAIFAFVLPAHVVLEALGVPSPWPKGLAPM